MSKEPRHREAPRHEAPPEAPPVVTEPAEFRFLLLGLALTPEAEERIAQAIRGAIQQQLAALGHEGRFTLAPVESRAQARPLLSESSRVFGIIVKGSQT
ncbi:MAG: hypothetical protein JXB05_14820 [Myxococcaceae bacterium]|nr:hypothetical protein [Myxococcaceae bacterium]